MGKKIAVDLITRGRRPKGAVVLALTGELGSGKTTFAQGLAKGLGIKGRIISPTFILMRKYVLGFKNHESRFENFYHVDMYRFEDNIEAEAKNLGIEEVWDNPRNIVVIEWAEKIKDLVPKKAIWVEFETLGGDERRIITKDL